MSCSESLADASVQSLREFYELLTLLRLLGPCIAPRTQGSLSITSVGDHPYTPLRRFLDRLSWLCDFESGGDTVSSVALEETTEGTKFWVSTTYKYAEATETHLWDILGRLSAAHSLSASDSFALEQDIANKCIGLSMKRVKTYARLLVNLFEKCRSQLKDSDAQLARDISHLTRLESSHSELCAKADHFRDSESLRLLSRRVSSVTSPSVWSMLRHYIGRLGSWHRASRVVVSYASMRPQIFIDFQVIPLPTPKPIFVPRANESTHLDSVLARLFSGEEQLELKRGIQMLQRLRGLDLDSSFQKEYNEKNFRPRVHAEVWMLEHFYLNNLSFLDGDKYVGCSKPSCYCCTLYLTDRTGGEIERPSHGNVWTKWQPPLHQDSNNQSLDAAIRSRMMAKFKEDLKVLILRPVSNTGKLPDSTTGFTPSGIPGHGDS